MFAPRLRLAPAIAFAAALAVPAVLGGCAAQPAPETGGFAVKALALSGTCGSAASESPLSEIKRFKLIVREPLADGSYANVTSQELSYAAGAKSVTFKDIPAGSPREVTLLGYTAAGAEPAWYARKSALTIKKLETQSLDVTLMASEGFTCVGPDGGQSKTVFSVATRIASDKILITGGFADAKVDGADTVLGLPQSQTWLFNPSKGTFTDAGQLLAARGGHSAVYLPSSGKILVVGGVNEMRVKSDGSEPPRWTQAQGVNPRWELCKLNDNDQLECETDGDSMNNLRVRVLPNLAVLNADYVVSAGGAPWPATDTQDYRNADLFDPTLKRADGTKGSFAKLNAGMLAMHAPRAAAAMAPFSTTTSAGTLQYLMWGGNETIIGGSQDAGKVMESVVESTNSGDVLFSDTYTMSGDDPQVGGSLFFSQIVNFGTATDPDTGEHLDRFVAIGGVRSNGVKWSLPSKDDAFLVTIRGQGKLGGASADVRRMAGLEAGVYLHNASAAQGHVVVSGGLTGLKSGGATLTDFAVNPDDPLGPLVGSVPPAAGAFVARGGQAAHKLGNDCLLLFGGVTDYDDLKVHDGGASDVYCPGFLAQ